MKKYVVFICSFVLLYVAFQFLSGIIMTLFYTPDLSVIENNVPLSQEVAFGKRSISPFVMSLLLATISFFVSQKVSNE